MITWFNFNTGLPFLIALCGPLSYICCLVIMVMVFSNDWVACTVPCIRADSSLSGRSARARGSASRSKPWGANPRAWVGPLLRCYYQPALRARRLAARLVMKWSSGSCAKPGGRATHIAFVNICVTDFQVLDFILYIQDPLIWLFILLFCKRKNKFCFTKFCFTVHLCCWYV